MLSKTLLADMGKAASLVRAPRFLVVLEADRLVFWCL